MFVFVLRESETIPGQNEMIVAQLKIERIEEFDRIINETEVHTGNGKTFCLMHIAFINMT